MSLPLDFTTSMWMTWTPEWEWVPVPPPEGCDAPADDAAEANAGSLVFKGYTLDAQAVVLPTDSLWSRPWEQRPADGGDAPRRHRGTPPVRPPEEPSPASLAEANALRKPE
jgi:hypothetical protein